MNGQKKIKQAAQFLLSTLRNSHLYMLNFAKLKTFTFQCELETKTKTFKAIDLKVKTISMFDLHCTAYNAPLYTPFLQHRKVEI